MLGAVHVQVGRGRAHAARLPCQTCSGGCRRARSRTVPPCGPSCPICPAGAFNDKIEQSSCEPCPTGKYLNDTSFPTIDATLHDEESDCKACPSGRNTNAIGSASVDSCFSKLCIPGKYGLDPNCKDCTVGFYSNEEGAAQCTECPDGESSNEGSTFCSQCKAGEFLDKTKSPAICVACKKGAFAESGSSECTLCPRGKWAKLDKTFNTSYQTSSL